MTFWRHFRTDPFIRTLMLGLLITMAAGSTQAQEPEREGAPSPYGTLIYKSITKDIEERAAARQRGEEERLEATVAQPLQAPANDNFANAIALGDPPGSVSGTNVDATFEPGEPPHAGVAGISSVWYTFTPDETISVTFDTVGSDFDTVLAVYTGDSVDALTDTEIASNDDIDPGFILESRVVFLAEAGTTYSIAVDGFQGEQGNFTLNFNEIVPGAPPPNDDFQDAIALQGQSGSIPGTNIDATAEPGEPVHADVAGISSVWYTFTPDETGRIRFDTFGSDFDTVLAVYTGDSVDALTEVASNDDVLPGILFTSEVAFLAQAGVTYNIAVDGFQGAQGSFTLNFGQPPTNDDFEDAVALEGEGTVPGSNFVATVQSGEPEHAGFNVGRSVWYTLTSQRTRVVELRVVDPTDDDASGDRAIFAPVLAVYSGPTVDALTEVASSLATAFTIDDDGFVETQSLPLAFLAEAGVTYSIAVDALRTGSGGAFILEFDRANRLPPDNDDLADAIALEGRRGSVTGNSAGATREAGEFNLFQGFVGNTRSVWYSFTSDQTSIVTVDTFGSDFDTVLTVFDGLSVIAFNDDADNGRQSEVAFLAESGVTYFIAVDGFNGARGDFTLNFERANRQSPGNDAFASARRLIGPSGIVSGLNVNATLQPDEPVPSDPGIQGGSSVWWRWRAPFSGEVTFTTAGSTFDTVLAVYQGPRVSELTEIGSNDDVVLPNRTIEESLVTFEAEQGRLYHIQVDGFAGDAGSITLAWTPDDPPLKRGVGGTKGEGIKF